MNKPFSTEIELIRRYGGPVSHAALEPSRSLFRAPGIDGLVGFLPVGRCAVVMGDPVCASEDKPRLASAFADFCAGKGWSALYIAASPALHAYARERGYTSMEFANLLMADPQDDPEGGPAARHLRQALNHTRREGVTVREYQGLASPDAGLEKQLRTVCREWVADRKGLQMYMVGCPRLFEDRPGRRWFVAEQSGQAVGMLSMLDVGCAGCRHLINLAFSSPAAPRHTNELMVCAALRALREEGVRSVCLGIGPLESLGQIEGCGAATEFFSRRLYRWADRLMNLHGKSLFWGKFRVTQKEPLYLLFQSPKVGLREINALLRALHFSLAGSKPRPQPSLGKRPHPESMF